MKKQRKPKYTRDELLNFLFWLRENIYDQIKLDAETKPSIDIVIDRIQDIYESEATWDEDYGIPLLSRKGYGLLEVLLAEYV